jgi:hypothetical protein
LHAVVVTHAGITIVDQFDLRMPRRHVPHLIELHDLFLCPGVLACFNP